MPTKKWIDKKKALNFALVHRSHEDAHYYDEDASSGVFMPISKDNKKKHQVENHEKNQKQLRVETKDDLAEELGVEGKIRSNEGEAALYGITYDDSEYDYMQHLKPIGGTGDGVYIPKKQEQESNKKPFELKEILPEGMLPSEQEKYDYQRQQDVPDEISGFKPDLNPDVREALEALDDDAYLDDSKDVDDVDVFATLLSDKRQKDLTLREYDVLTQEEAKSKDQWDLDQYDDEYENNGETKEVGDFSWEKDFKNFKSAQTKGKIRNDWDTDDEFESEEEEEEEEERDTVGEMPKIGGISSGKKAKSKKAKRKKGATTDTSSYSMSSSALCRTEQLSIIDDRFDVMKQKYDKNDGEDEEEEGEKAQPFDFKNERSDFASMIDDFLDNYEQKGKRIIKKDAEAEKIKKAADTVSKSKLAERRRKEKKALTKGIRDLNLN
ncbi:hypothetical protein FOA43_003153 [Brettanomyces nanus]|uniref:Low temperature viability protein n=1 Tax=Eeniella nana TaxID=13502 RepID=A0A875S768_EENNA|nr:uncharacterized protein FOA43_003153 [Brettanomyces nanus]QPG75792.1 hypothetical protein FOA43_003153 [Brettanomyces nanus]